MNAQTIAALLATSTISFAPSIILVLFPNFDTDSLALSLGKSLAAGGLLGDVFLHTLPHSQHDDKDVNVGAWVLVGFCSFLAMDMLVRTVNGNDHDHHDNHAHNKGHSHSHSHANTNGTTKSTETTYTASVDKFASSTVLLNLAADSLHNFTDGVAIGTSFAASSPTTSVDTSVDRGAGLPPCRFFVMKYRTNLVISLSS